MTMPHVHNPAEAGELNTSPPAEERRPTARLRPPSWRLELLITLLGLLGLGLFLAFYDRAFPSAALDLALSRAEIAQRAQAYLESQGHELDGYEFVLTFGGDSWASYYLQRTLGIAETNRLIREARLPIWYWRARWFRPLQKEEFRAYPAPDGELTGLSHILLEDAPGASLSQEQARALATDYLSQDRGWALEEWEEVSASSQDRPGGRTDHTFEWKRSDWDVGESELRLAVRVQGDRIGYYNYWLKVPEKFQRDFVEQRHVASFISGVSLMLSVATLGVTLLIGLWKAKWQVSSSLSTAARLALAVGAVALLAGVNELGLAKAGYSTTADYTLFWVSQGTSILVWTLFNVVLVSVLWYVGQWLSKRVWPRQDRILSRRGDRWRRLARSSWRGLMLGFMMGGYVVLFYLAATQLLGGWKPMGPEYSNAYATPLPFLSALESGLLPATWEELTFRLALISAVLWLTRSFTRLPEPACRFLALLIPGALWGFGHLSYVRDPLYMRGVELTLAAVLLEGLFFLRFDLTTTIVAHFVYNAGLGALPLLRSGEPYFVASGAVVVAAMLAPVIPGLAREVRRRLRGEPGPAPPRIRSVSARDVASLQALPIEGVEWDILVHDPAAAVLCLQAGEEVVGVAAGRVADGTRGQASVVYVAPTWRRRYWGSELVAELRTRLEKKGARTIEVQVNADDKAGTGFWTDQGWDVAKMTFQWPPSPPVRPSWRDAVRRVRKWVGI